MSSASLPTISIIVPTRDRCDTLVATLRTCLDQQYPRCEIIVSDNFSGDGTREHVASLRDPRLKYVRTDRRLGMSQNWEFALAQASGDYLTFVGDDDALLPKAVSDLAELARATGSSAITWRPASYVWPNSIHLPSRNLLFVPSGEGFEERRVAPYLRQVLDFRRNYDELPTLYKGIVRTDLVRGIAARSGGKFFQSMNPDVYSAIALSLVLDEYHYSRCPYSINGTSGHSNSASQLSPSLGARAAQAFMKEDNIPFHADLVFAPCMALAVAESFLQARDRLRTKASFSVDMRRLYEAMADEISSSEKAVYDRTCDALRTIAAKHGLEDLVEALLAERGYRLKPPPIGLVPGYNVIHKIHIVNCAELGVQDIHQAAAICKTIVDARRVGLARDPLATARTTLALAKGLVGRLYRRWTRTQVRISRG